MDPSSPLFLAQVPLLLIPVGRVRTSTWQRYTSLFSSIDQLPQSDIPLDGTISKSRFFPSLSSSFAATSAAVGSGLVKNNNNNGVHLTWTTGASGRTSTAAPPADGGGGELGLIRPTSQPLGLVAIVDLHPTCTPSLPMASHLLAQELAERSFEGGRPLVVRCFGVEGEEGEGVNGREVVIDSNEGGARGEGGTVTVVPKVEEMKGFLEALVAEMVGRLLAELAELATGLESPSGMALLQQHALPPLSLFSSLPPSSNHAHTDSRSSTPVSQFSLLRGETLPTNHRSTPPGSRQLGNGHPSTPALGHLSQPPMQRSSTSSSLRSGETNGGQVKTSFGGVGRKRIISPSPSLPPPPMTSTPPPTSSPTPLAPLPLATARLASVLASFFLLSGRLGDAQASFTDSLLAFSKLPPATGGDPLWHGMTLEGLATAATLIECKPKSPTVGPPSTTASHELISTHLNNALALYGKVTGQTTSESTLPNIFTNAALRHARLLLTIYQRGALSPSILPFLGRLPAALPPDHPPAAGRETLTKLAVAQLATASQGPWIVLLSNGERLDSLSVLVRVMQALGMRRKEAVYARSLVACLGEMIVLARIQHQAGGSSSSTTTMTAVGSGTALDGTVGVRVEDETTGNQALLEMMDRYLLAYGVDVEVQGLFARKGEEEVKEIWAGLGGQGGGEGEGWVELQLRALRDSIGLAEVLPDHHSVVSYALTMLRVLHRFISPGEQAHLGNVFGRALATARRRGQLVEGDRLRFWAGWVVMSMEVPPLPAASVPVQHDMQEREVVASTSSGAARDPFLFNPRVVAQLGASTLVQNELFDVLFTLQNAFAFPLEIQNVRLSTEGPEVICDPLPIVLAPKSVQSVKVSAHASTPGALTIKGCFVRLADGSEAEFLLPVHDAAEDKRQRKRESQKQDTERTLKLSGLQKVLDVRAKRESTRLVNGWAKGKEDVVNYIRCEVLPEQPTIRIRGTSLTHGAMMLYAGEETTIRITLENVGHLPIDFVNLSFQDSTTGPIEMALSEGDLSAGEAYELESDRVRQPVFTWKPSTEKLLIPPRGRHTIHVTCLGKVGCAWGNVQVSYAFLDRQVDPRPSTFHTRQISFPILMSVYHTLECTALDVLRIPHSSSPPKESAEGSAMERTSSARTLVAALQDEEHHDHCLVAIDIRNTYAQPFEVTFRRKAAGKEGQELSSTRLISSGATERIVLPLRRFLLSTEKVSSPIPSLGNRQFVVSKSKTSTAEEQRLRSLFWYREALMETIETVWREPGSARYGVLPLRSQSMTEPMLEVLRADEVVINLSVDVLGTPTVERSPRSNEFYDIVARVRNRLPRALSPVVHLAPVTFSPPSSWAHDKTSIQPSPNPAMALQMPEETVASQYFIHSGLLSQILPSRLILPNEEVEIRFRVGLLAEGKVDFRVCVEELPTRPRRSRRKLLPREEEGSGETMRRVQGTAGDHDENRNVWFSDNLSVAIE